MIVLGISAYHGDSAAAIIKDGKIIAAVEEERLNRVKHWAGFPLESIKFCLQEAGVSIEQVDYIAINRDPKANIGRKALYSITHSVPWSFIKDRLKNRSSVTSVAQTLANELGGDPDLLQAKVQHVEHHIAHAASSFFVSKFEKADLISVDGAGDWSCTMFAQGEGTTIKPLKRIFFPDSLGVFYTALTQYLGFPHYGDEYKVMGLAPYGEPKYMDQMREIIPSEPDGLYKLNLKYFVHQQRKKSGSWEDGIPVIHQLFSEEIEKLLGPTRTKEEPLEQRHRDIAASIQLRYEEVLLGMLNYLHKLSGNDALCISGGCAMNSVANGRVLRESPYKDIFIPPQPGDAGGAAGAAAYTYVSKSGNRMEFIPTQAYVGPSFAEDDFYDDFVSKVEVIDDVSISRKDDEHLFSHVAEAISQGKVIGWFQGKMEWGPRALGNRSILSDPRRADMKDILNLKIKRRESFRPFAPSIASENVSDFFETDYDVPYMSMVFQIKKDKRPLIPAVTHVNGSGRLQTVCKEENEKYWNLIKAFEKITDVPIILNTSFNENEPIVCQPAEALDCFLRTKMDLLVAGNVVVERTGASSAT